MGRASRRRLEKWQLAQIDEDAQEHSPVMRRHRLLTRQLLPLLLLSCTALLGAAWAVRAVPHSRPRRDHPQLYGFKILHALPHDDEAFTQGLEYDRRCSAGAGGQLDCRDIFWESTGMNGQSTVREVDLETGKVLRKKHLSRADFGEGLTKFKDRLVQLTWRVPKGYSYAADNFNDVRMFTTPLQDGWGLTTDGSALIVSDGTDVITWLDPVSYAKKQQLRVTDGDRSVRYLNELEWIEGEIWANVWLTECIARIDPTNGKVRGWISLYGMRTALEREAGVQRVAMDVLNGIAYDKANKRVFVTGKNWSKVYEVEVTPRSKMTTRAEIEETRSLCIR